MNKKEKNSCIETLKRRYACKQVSLKELEDIECNEYVDRVMCCGNSGFYIGYYYYSITCTDGSEFAVYTKGGELLDT